MNSISGTPLHQERLIFLEASMARTKKTKHEAGLENMSVNSSRRNAGRDDSNSPAHEKARVPDQQIPVEESPGLEDTEGHPT